MHSIVLLKSFDTHVYKVIGIYAYHIASILMTRPS